MDPITLSILLCLAVGFSARAAGGGIAHAAAGIRGKPSPTVDKWKAREEARRAAGEPPRKRPKGGFATAWANAVDRWALKADQRHHGRMEALRELGPNVSAKAKKRTLARAALRAKLADKVAGWSGSSWDRLTRLSAEIREAIDERRARTIDGEVIDTDDDEPGGDVIPFPHRDDQTNDNEGVNSDQSGGGSSGSSSSGSSQGTNGSAQSGNGSDQGNGAVPIVLRSDGSGPINAEALFYGHQETDTDSDRGTGLGQGNGEDQYTKVIEYPTGRISHNGQGIELYGENIPFFGALPNTECPNTDQGHLYGRLPDGRRYCLYCEAGQVADSASDQQPADQEPSMEGTDNMTADTAQDVELAEPMDLTSAISWADTVGGHCGKLSDKVGEDATVFENNAAALDQQVAAIETGQSTLTGLGFDGPEIQDALNAAAELAPEVAEQLRQMEELAREVAENLQKIQEAMSGISGALTDQSGISDEVTAHVNRGGVANKTSFYREG